MEEQQPEGHAQVEATRRKRRWKGVVRNAAILLLTTVIVLGTWHVLSPRSSPINYLLTGETLPAVPRVPRPATLDPSLFAGRAAEGYRVARERPALLEQIPCYCGCYLSDGHQNALDCFRGRHAENCTVCLDIVLRAAHLERQGYSPADIKALIDRQFAKKTPWD